MPAAPPRPSGHADPRPLAPRPHGRDAVAAGLRTFLASEAAGWRAIGRFLTVRPRMRRGAEGFSWDRPTRTVLVVFLVLSAIEVPIVDLIVHPWPAVRFPLLALGVWGVITMLGMLLVGVTRPHGVGPDGILVRAGAAIEIWLPWDVIASVERRRVTLASAPSPALIGPEEDAILVLAVQDGTDIEIALEGVTVLALPQGETAVRRVRFAVDDPSGFLDAVRHHIP